MDECTWKFGDSSSVWELARALGICIVVVVVGWLICNDRWLAHSSVRYYIINPSNLMLRL